ncbi:MAG TPA: methylated-DNA--[protein]-cysteine S-methyltransferase [Pseudacidobacterium sp.]|jgi:AraC family transcriptional regulator of adaptative response/methylated-DNA-[protein]-cysteine methyltransferase|nr:methylated-DNA--[protein]-cysteine S-methyltransferase [Pseudacidobacterium sp.]
MATLQVMTQAASKAEWQPLFPLPSRKAMEQAYLSSDSSYDGIFYIAVKTTGIFCLPSCKAKKPLPENVKFFATIKEALFAGFRPCLRCKPMEQQAATPDWIRRVLHAVDAEPGRRFTDQDLRALDSDPVRVRRYFAKHFGLTFQAYCRGRRLSRALESIRNGSTLDNAVFDAGFASHSGFRESFANTFGQPPGRFDALDPIQLAWIDTPLGPMIAGGVRNGLCLLEFTDRRMLETEMRFLRKHFSTATVPGESPHHALLREDLQAYFAGQGTTFSSKFLHVGTEFEQRVWEQLSLIPYGATVSYEEIAHSVGSPGAVRAVGRANGLNRFAIVVPCHRVIGKNGDLTGYGGGLWRKRLLLELERANAHA